MTRVVESEKDGPVGESNINVKSLRMRFEKSDGPQEGAATDKCRDVKIASKASESIKKFESLVKQEPGFKPSESLGHSLSKSMPNKGSVRVGSLRHKFESLANRSLTADIFNAPDGPGDDQDQDPSSKQVSSQDNSETASTRDSGNNAEGKSSATEGSSETLSDTIAVEVSEHVPHIPVEGEVIAEEASTFTIETEDSIEEPGLCLKEQIERAQADEMRAVAADNPPKLDVIEHDAVVYTEVAENIIAELHNTAVRTLAENNVSSQQWAICSSDDAAVISNGVSIDNLSAVSPATNASRDQASAIAVSEEHFDADNTPQAQLNLKTEVNNRLEDPVELDAENEQALVEIKRSQPHTPKSRRFLQRLFTCGASV